MMNIRLLQALSLLLAFFMSAIIHAKAPGPLVTITATGGQAPFNVNVWLNGDASLSGQSINITGGYTLTVTPTNPNHLYPAMGIEITTPGLSMNAGCSRFVGNRCIFSASNSQPATITVSGGSGGNQLRCVNQTGGICRVFVTSTTFNSGNIKDGTITATGTAGACATTDVFTRANCICNSDGNYPGTGTFKAWLTTSSVLATSNIQYDNGKLWSYVRANDTATTISNAGKLTTPPLSNSITDGVGGNTIWTNTTATGLEANTTNNCSNFTSAFALATGIVGVSDAIISSWSESAAKFCSAGGYSIYCFEIP